MDADSLLAEVDVRPHASRRRRMAEVGRLAASAGTVRVERARAPDLLALFAARRNEPDPVRGAMLRGLADLPPGLWRDEHLPALDTLFRQALDAPDLSAASASAMERLMAALLPHHPDWAAGWLAVRARKRGGFGPAGSSHRLSEADVRAFAPTMTLVIREWRERDRAPLWFANHVGRRLRVFDALAEAVEAALRQTPHAAVADAALMVLARHRPDRLPALVPDLLREDGSAVLLPPVQAFLHRHRQDLLAPFLGRLAATGRFATGRTAPALRFDRGFGRWTPDQQDGYASGLLGLVADEARDTPTVLWAVRTLGALPATRPDALILLADPGDTRPGVRDTALRALGLREAALDRPGRAAAALATVEAGLAALVAQAEVAGRGWTGNLVARLRALRLDPSPMVAGAAGFTFVPGEAKGREVTG